MDVISRLPLLHEGRLGLATAYQKYGKPEPKKRPVIDLKFDPTIKSSPILNVMYYMTFRNENATLDIEAN